MDKLFRQLNERQAEAVRATEGRIRIVAGAGSGKTRVIAHRYAYLVEVLGIDPANILCMTFTNKAAQEMKNRIGRLVHRGNVNDFVCTIHGFCVRFLRAEIFRLGYPKTFQIIDEEDAKSIAKNVFDQLQIDRKKTTIKKFLAKISAKKGQDRTAYVGKYLLPDSQFAQLDNAYICYLHEQLKNFALDFDDLVYFTLYILQNFPEVRQHWQDEINYVQMDEVQDCDGDEWELFTTLSEGSGNLCIVGDPDQAIYEWRGAKPQLFVSFNSDKDILLTENYRSTPNILNVANSIINHNQDRIPKELFTNQPDSVRVLHMHAKSEEKEARFIAERIQDMVKADKAAYSDFAVLFRAAYLSRAIEQEMIRLKIHYTVWGGIRFFERKEIKDSLAYLRLVVNPRDNMAFRRICNEPPRKFGKKSQDWLEVKAAEEGVSLMEALVNHAGDKELSHCQLDSLIQVILQGQRHKMEGRGIHFTLDYLLENSGLKADWRKDEDEDRLENALELLNSITQYEDQHRNDEEGISFEQYLQDIALYTNADYRKDADSVKLMTIHQAKGLEFPYVFVTGMSEGIFPSHRAIRERKKSAEEEERRLMYVAATRAMKELVLTESEGFSANTQGEKYPSRFLSEITPNLIEVKGNIPSYLLEGTKMAVEDLNEELGIDQPVAPVVEEEIKKEAEIGPGTKVEHPIFGIGEIMEIKPNGSYVVNFEKGRRTVMPMVVHVL